MAFEGSRASEERRFVHRQNIAGGDAAGKFTVSSVG